MIFLIGFGIGILLGASTTVLVLYILSIGGGKNGDF
jgi:hypothetical protein